MPGIGTDEWIIQFCDRIAEVRQANKRFNKINSQYNDGGRVLGYEQVEEAQKEACQNLREMMEEADLL